MRYHIACNFFHHLLIFHFFPRNDEDDDHGEKEKEKKKKDKDKKKKKEKAEGGEDYLKDAIFGKKEDEFLCDAEDQESLDSEAGVDDEGALSKYLSSQFLI